MLKGIKDTFIRVGKWWNISLLQSVWILCALFFIVIILYNTFIWILCLILWVIVGAIFSDGPKETEDKGGA